MDVFAEYQNALRAGHQLAADGRFAEALERYEAAAGMASERARPHVHVGDMLQRLGRPREALEAYERALAREPTNADAAVGRVAALLAAGRRAEALDAQRQLNAANPEPAAEGDPAAGLRTPLTRAESLAVAGEEARDAGRTDAAIDAWLAESREHAAAGSFDAALDAALRALSLDPRAARTHLELTRVYVARRWPNQASLKATSLARLLELAPDPAVAQELAALQPPRA